MANHGFVSSKKNLTQETVLEDLNEINQRRFKGLLKIEPSQWGKKGSWFISYQEDSREYPEGFNIWIRSARMLEHRHTRGWSYYLEMVFSNELGKLYGGKISDECCSEKWSPEPEKYPTYRAWLDCLYGHIKESYPDHYQKMIDMDMETCPKEFIGM